MSDPNQNRINELARELEIKAKVLIDYLPEIGVTEKKTHSSSLDLNHAELVRKHFQGLAAAEAVAEAEKEAKAKAARTQPAARTPAPATPRRSRRASGSCDTWTRWQVCRAWDCFCGCCCAPRCCACAPSWGHSG